MATTTTRKRPSRKAAPDPIEGLVTSPSSEQTLVGINVRIPYDLHRQLKIKLIQQDLTLPEAITLAVDRWVQS